MFDLHEATTFLFVPGSRPDRYDKAASSGADVVILDLEDGVEPSARPEARRSVVAWLRAGNRAVVRISARGTEDHEADLRALRNVAGHVMLSKTETPEDVDDVTGELGGAEVLALIETARGVLAAPAVAARASVVRLAFGNVDLSTELGVTADDGRALLTARSMLVLASAAGGLPGPIDGITTSFGDKAAILRDAADASQLGFSGKLCVHPNQLRAARDGFAPSTAQVEWARKVLAQPSAGEARAVGGSMVDRPLEERARALLRRAAVPPPPE